MVRNPPYGEAFDSPQWTRWIHELVFVINQMGVSGTTAQRPVPAPFIGFLYFDTTIGKPIWAKTATQYVLADGTNI